MPVRVQMLLSSPVVRTSLRKLLRRSVLSVRDCLPVKCDVTSAEQLDAAVEAVLAHFGKADILVNNCGGGPSAPLEEISDETFMLHVNLELMATFRLTRAFGRGMLERGYGRVINIGSILGSAA